MRDFSAPFCQCFRGRLLPRLPNVPLLPTPVQEPPDRGFIIDDQNAGRRFYLLASSGNRMMIRMPLPSALTGSARMKPPWASTRPLQIAKPSPVPERCLSPLSARQNISNTLSGAPLEIPGPLSATDITAKAPPSRATLWIVLSVRAYLAALSWTLMIARSVKIGSASNAGRSAGS